MAPKQDSTPSAPLAPKQESKLPPSMTSKLVAEFTGTFLLIFTIGCNVLSGSGMWAGISIASVLMVSIFAFGGISGANFNPAVSVALGINEHLNGEGSGMKWPEVGMYSGVQIGAGIAAGFVYKALFGKAFALGPAKGFNIGQAGAAEVLYTFMLCFVVLNVAAVKKGCQEWFGLAIGFVIIAGAYGAGAISGGCFNPAVAIGIDVSHQFVPMYSLAYTAFQLVGAALAAGLFKVVRPLGGEKGESEAPTMTSKLVSEFIGTYILVLTVGLNVMAKSPAGAFSIAASLMCMIYALGDVSGANFNPAVSLALLINKTHDAKTAGAYMGAQLVGGMTAAITYAIVAGGSFPLGPQGDYKASQVIVAELIFTFVLCLVVLCAAVEKETASANFFALAIGSCVTVGGNAIGAISGGSLNPAVSFGIATGALAQHGVKSMLYAGIYSLAEFAGAGLAAGLVMATHNQVVKTVEGDAEKASN